MHFSNEGHTDPLDVAPDTAQQAPADPSVRTGLPEERGVLEAGELGINPTSAILGPWDLSKPPTSLKLSSLLCKWDNLHREQDPPLAPAQH